MRLIADYLFGIVCVFQEAEAEPLEGKQAVAEVIQRRTKRKFMSDGTVAGTVFRRLQFSGMNHNAKNRIRSFQIDTSNPIVGDCVRAWVDAERGPEIVPDCMHYYNPLLCSPSWAQGAKIVKKIGNHLFVIPKE
jgi:N-acetylmuramoyl-L-alanine amidase